MEILNNILVTTKIYKKVVKTSFAQLTFKIIHVKGNKDHVTKPLKFIYFRSLKPLGGPSVHHYRSLRL